MPATTCNPADRGLTYNKTEMALQGGAILVTILWGWDGVSTIPNCNGPVQSIRVRNNSAATYYANLPNKKKPPLYVEIPAGTDATISGKGTLRNYGLETFADTRGVTLHAQPLA